MAVSCATKVTGAPTGYFVLLGTMNAVFAYGANQTMSAEQHWNETKTASRSFAEQLLQERKTDAKKRTSSSLQRFNRADNNLFEKIELCNFFRGSFSAHRLQQIVRRSQAADGSVAHFANARVACRT